MQNFDVIIGPQFAEKVIPLINCAKSSINIIMFDWRWYPNDPASKVQLFNQSVIRALKRGVQVRAVVNNGIIASILKGAGINAKKVFSDRLLHCKLMIIDESVVIIGSHNYTQNAFNTNFELSVCLSCPESMPKMLVFFNNLFNNN